MNTDFRIGLISDDPYHLGLLKGYCHAHHYKVFESTDDKESINTMIQIQPNIVILAVGLAQDQDQKINFDLIRDMSINHKIPVCYLRDVNNIANVEKEITCWVDATLDAPLDVNQLNDYLHNKFKFHRGFIQEKRNYERRTANDRRVLMLERQNEADCNYQPDDKSVANNDDCFIVEPFQIDQRSKSVLFNGKLLNLTRKEFELFELLAKDIDRVFMTQEIINHLWPENNRATKSDLYQYMHLLRKKIEDDPNNPQWILTVKGFGYKLNAAAPTKMH
ncbi:DNA-binding response regulator [Methylobacter sp.]|uniref:DNA-binding response regulator n=1 Tax=Methylobacter sp. TaxID=2051955 RepID=UPI002FDD6837